VLTLQLLSKKIGEELDGIVTGLASFGLFVQSKKYGVEGLIRMEDLGSDRWAYDMKAQCILGERSGYSIRLGQAIKVRIVSVNIPARQLNVTPAEPLAGTDQRKQKSQRTKKSKRRKRRR
jgi:ribonuclease R